MTSYSNVQYNHRTWHIVIRDGDDLLIEWHNPDKRQGSNYAIRWIKVAAIEGPEGHTKQQSGRAKRGVA